MGVLITSMPSEANTSSKLAVNFASRSSDQEPERPTVLGEIPGEVAGNLGDEGAGRMIGDTEDVDYAALELDDEQHIELVETDRVHDEEVGSQDALGLGGEELLPGRSTARSWSETVARSTRRIELAETRIPSPRSSP